MIEQLVLVEWVDSVQPDTEWQFVDKAPPLALVECKSVGWIIDKNKHVMMVAPNVGHITGNSEQCLGLIRIPMRSIERVTVLNDSITEEKQE